MRVYGAVLVLGFSGLLVLGGCAGQAGVVKRLPQAGESVGEQVDSARKVLGGMVGREVSDAELRQVAGELRSGERRAMR